MTWTPNANGSTQVPYKITQGGTPVPGGSGVLDESTDTQPVDGLLLGRQPFQDMVSQQIVATGQPVVFTLSNNAAYNGGGGGLVIADAVCIMADNPASQTAYDTDGNVLSQTDADGNTATYQYNALNQQIQMTQPATTQHAAAVTSYVYDLSGNLMATFAPLGRVAAMTYDAGGNAVAAYQGQAAPTTPSGTTTTCAFTGLPSGNAVTNTPLCFDVYANYGADSNRADYQVTGGGAFLPNAETDANAPWLGAGWTLVGTVQASSPTTSSLTFTTSGSPSPGQMVLLAQTSQTAYDLAGNAVSRTDALGNATSYAYNNLNELVTTTDPAGHVATTVYDAAGRQTATIDLMGLVTAAVYDGLGRQIESDQGSIVESVAAHRAIPPMPGPSRTSRPTPRRPTTLMSSCRPRPRAGRGPTMSPARHR